MEMEQFKMIIDLLQNVQEGAMAGVYLFIIWLVVKLLITWVGALLLVRYLFQGVSKLIKAAMGSEIEGPTLLSFANQLGTKTLGEFTTREKEATKKKLAEIVAEYVSNH